MTMMNVCHLSFEHGLLGGWNLFTQNCFMPTQSNFDSEFVGAGIALVAVFVAELLSRQITFSFAACSHY